MPQFRRGTHRFETGTTGIMKALKKESVGTH